ncbi:hypothetical protein MHBO_000710 [Bonamia ostreae]|uniref:Uncharacterized protein n=1 Tax=Bonamia ostreae TaxID=126728 RepID=A0ABV2AGS2_9EUKA
MDVTSPESIDNAFKTIKKTENKIDVLINNAGQVALKDKNALSCDENSLKDCFQTNAIGPFLVTKTFLPLLVQSQNPKILNVTSYWGSMSDKNKKISSFLTSYRVSKAAANMLSKCLAIDLNKKKISVVSINPGWVNTEMGRFGGKFHPILSPEESAKGIIKLVDSVNLSMSGKFLNYDGSELSY